jgi:hypothetical protein
LCKYPNGSFVVALLVAITTMHECWVNSPIFIVFFCRLLPKQPTSFCYILQNGFVELAIVKERDTQLECTKIWYFFSPLLTPFLGVLTIDRTLKCQTVDIIWNFFGSK